MIVPALN